MLLELQSATHTQARDRLCSGQGRTITRGAGQTADLLLAEGHKLKFSVRLVVGF